MSKFVMKKNMKFIKVKSIKTLILISILPVVLISLVIMGIFSNYTSKKLITTEIENRMKHQLQETINLINKDMEKHAQIAVDLGKFTGASRMVLTKAVITKAQEEVLFTNKDTLGVGVFLNHINIRKN